MFKFLIGIPAIGVAHAVAFLTLYSNLKTIAFAGKSIPRSLILGLDVLTFSICFLPPSLQIPIWSILDNETLRFGYAAFNGLLWGLILTAIFGNGLGAMRSNQDTFASSDSD